MTRTDKGSDASQLKDQPSRKADIEGKMRIAMKSVVFLVGMLPIGSTAGQAADPAKSIQR